MEPDPPTMTHQTKRTPKLYGRILPTGKLSADTITALYELFSRYYESVSREKFLADLSEKSHVIVLRDRACHQVQGFCTLMVWQQVVQGRRCTVLYTGDTVVDKAYWGQRVLQRCFGQFMVRVRLRHPFTKVYWFLISKGYRTYLLLTNNFFGFYPRWDRPTPPLESEIIHTLGQAKFGAEYVPELGVVIYKDSGGQVKDGIAEITADMLANPHIRFFAEKNPGYRLGHELACLGEVQVSVVVRNFLKDVRKALGFGRKSAPRSAEPQTVPTEEVSVG